MFFSEKPKRKYFNFILWDLVIVPQSPQRCFYNLFFCRGKNVLSGINYVHYNIGIQFLIQNLYY